MSEEVIYLAGGCFWGLEHLMHSLKGVNDAISGYANGTGADDANYKTVCTGQTGFHETVKVTYDRETISLKAILGAYFYVIDPTTSNRQGHDLGTQYQTGIYYVDEDSRKIVEEVVAIEKARYSKFCVEVQELVNFYPAEEYHQRYLDKNPDGYCHIPRAAIAMFKDVKIDPGQYERPNETEIKNMLSVESYNVTQNKGTEMPFANAFYNNHAKGIYVDIVTGEPLFASSDQFDSGCGWPAFSKPIEAPVVVELEDVSHGMVRTEVRSSVGNSHLGHVFENDPTSPNGIRYCINSAALKFIPLEEMDEQGYGNLKVYVK